MTATLALELSADEADAVLNALNYFAHGIGPEECQTLIGLEQAQVQALHDRLRVSRQAQP